MVPEQFDRFADHLSSEWMVLMRNESLERIGEDATGSP